MGWAILPAAAFHGGFVPFAILRAWRVPAESRLQPELAALQSVESFPSAKKYVALGGFACDVYFFLPSQGAGRLPGTGPRPYQSGTKKSGAFLWYFLRTRASF